MIKRHTPYMINGLRLLLVDRGVLLVDFFIATGVAFFIQFLVWTSIYTDDQEINGFSFSELMIYCALTIFLSRLHNCYDLIEEMEHEIIDGRLEVLMARPIHFLAQKFFAYLGGGALYLLPVFLGCTLLWLQKDLFFASTISSTLIYLSIVCLFLLIGVVLSFAIGMILAMSIFWLMKADFVLAFLTTVVAFLGGAIIPPAFWPEFIRPLMEYNPFQYFISAPAQFIIHGDIHQGLQDLGISLLYVLALLLLLRGLWGRALKRYSGGGG
ncbi:ABC-2 family transporter protein [Xenorhabdus koppenhoeferi]|uniref:ABC-2 type transport system permease protein n=1 Tax=Xenorhabdus koppenhoeferi TaxID=351659 RepID=A0A1I7KIC4_9GAMM|nr:ABC-2 family transporter protein [Xenorhabdus koppenhoeferi]SFU97198.1 ABC-2 type transport system permease protein [Xenorhabdus koppenhoeferi]